MGMIKDKYVAKIKRTVSNRGALARLHGLKAGDVLRDLRGVPMVGMTFENTQQLLEDMHFLAQPFKITFIRKIHRFRSKIQQDVKKIMAQHQKSVKTWDKFIATLVTLLYLLYPTIIKATYQLVACQRVGSNHYLQMDLNVQCYGSNHLKWILNLFVPSFLGFVVGLPFCTLMILIPRRHHLYERKTRFRFGILHSGYTEKAFYWETIIAARKSAVISVSVFMTGAGPETQALCGMMIVMICTVLHLIYRPFAPVVEGKHDTLFLTEFCGLLVAFVT